ncbi:DUF5999 family protein [Streptomyces sp. NPDC057638]|uniref:DUF5999 family protein n=1 Tax=Streptomyces sp. NPDC057638 TaxID=3346190 RepID=UPI0036B65359
MSASGPPVTTGTVCVHQPTCPPADAINRDAARTVASCPEQGWSRLCNGVLTFEDQGELLPDGEIIAPRRLVSAEVAA